MQKNGGFYPSSLKVSEMFFVGRVQPASNVEKHAGFTRPTMAAARRLHQELNDYF
jgi:hypothetical protein